MHAIVLKSEILRTSKEIDLGGAVSQEIRIRSHLESDWQLIIEIFSL